MWFGLEAISGRLRALVQAGSRRVASERERRQVVAANMMGLGLFAMSWPYIGFFALANKPSLSVAVFFTCVGYLSAPVLNCLGYHLAAKIAPCVSGILVCYVFGSALGPDLHIHVSMVMLTGWSFNLFDVRRNPRTLLFFAITPGVLYAFVEFGVVLPVPPIEVVGSLGLFIGIVSLGFSYLLLVWVLWIFYGKNLRDEDSLESAIVSLQHEVGARKQAQSETQLAFEAARNAAEAKSRFLASMSHEFRTPLNGVLGPAQLLQDTTMNQEQRALLRDVQTSGAALLTLLNNVLDIAMMDRSSLQVTAGEVDLLTVLEESLEAAKARDRGRGIEWRLEVKSKAPKRILGDENRLRQVLYNLLSNASKFTSRGYVELRVTVDRHGDSEALVTIAVEDTGIGVPAELRDVIFERFTQANNGLDRGHDGAGLGLALCRAIVAAMGGVIGVRAREGGGSIFEFSLNVRVLEEEPESALSGQRAAYHGRGERRLGMPKILVAEDNPVNLKVLLKLLGKLGLSAVTCENGLLALNAFKGGKWDLVLMDVQMPEMDGIAATRAIRQFESTADGRHTPIIAVSANVLPEHMESGLKAGFDIYLTKPIKLSDLRRTLQTFITLPQTEPETAEKTA